MKKPFYKKVWFWVVVVVLVGGGMASMDSGSSDTQPTESNDKQITNNESNKEESDKVEEKTYKMNQKVNVGDMSYIISKKAVKKSVGPSILATDAKDTFLVVKLKVKNNGKESVTVDSNFFTLLSGDKEYEADSTASISANSKEDGSNGSFFLEQLNPDVSLSGYVVFDVPAAIAKSKDLRLKVQTGIWGTQTEEIRLVK